MSWTLFPDVALKRPAIDDQFILVFVSGLLQLTADLTPDKVTFKDPSRYAKGDNLTIIALTTA